MKEGRFYLTEQLCSHVLPILAGLEPKKLRIEAPTPMFRNWKERPTKDYRQVSDQPGLLYIESLSLG